MRILIASDKFRGSFTAAQVCRHLARGLREAARPATSLDVVERPMADGGEGTLEVALAAMGGSKVRIRVRGPLGEPIEADYGVSRGGAAVIECAMLCGLDRVPVPRRDPAKATSWGVGEAIARTLDAGVREIVLGLGGTATVDGGLGMALALGYRLYDAGARPIRSPVDLHRVARVDATAVHAGLASARVTALCDVSNPLLGTAGAARVFGPQKGASPDLIDRLEEGLAALARAACAWKGIPWEDAAARAGAGAAGGMGFGADLFLGARLAAGAEFLARLAGLPEAVEEADLVVTGEGSVDAQTLQGKVVAEVLALAGAWGRPAVVVAGRWDGSLPGKRPGSVSVLTPGDVHGASRFVHPDDLAAAGRLIFERLGADPRLAPGRRSGKAPAD